MEAANLITGAFRTVALLRLFQPEFVTQAYHHFGSLARASLRLPKRLHRLLLVLGFAGLEQPNAGSQIIADRRQRLTDTMDNFRRRGIRGAAHTSPFVIAANALRLRKTQSGAGPRHVKAYPFVAGYQDARW